MEIQCSELEHRFGEYSPARLILRLLYRKVGKSCPDYLLLLSPPSPQETSIVQIIPALLKMGPGTVSDAKPSELPTLLPGKVIEGRLLIPKALCKDVLAWLE